MFLFLRVIFFFPLFLIFKTILKVIVHLQLLQNIGFVPRVVQYILIDYLTPNICTSPSPPLYCPFPPPHW